MALRLLDGGEQPLQATGSQPLGDGMLWTFAADGITAEVTSAPAATAGDGHAGMVLDFAFDCQPQRLAQIDAVVLLQADVRQFGFTRTFANRRDIWLPVGLRDLEGRPLPDGPAHGDWDADNLLALFAPGADALLLGAVLPSHNALEFSVRDGVLRVLLPIETGYSGGRRLRGESLAVVWDRPLLESLEWYGRVNRVGCQPRGRKGPPVVWNTWDWYTSNISHKRLEEVLECLRTDPVLRDRVEVVCIDDGWAPRGDFLHPYAEIFPDLAGTARTIGDAGFVPGIWYAPFRVSASSEWVANHAETVLWGPARGHYKVPLTPAARDHALDYTHPLVLEKIARELAWLRQMGFRYFKTDFLQMPNTNFRRPELFDPHVTPVEGMRRAMHVIRAAIGCDSYWLACGTETLPAAGLPDASRIGDDITLRFSTAQVIARNAAAHFWLNGRVWINDPDFLVVRGRDTAEGKLLSAREEIECQPRERKPYQRAVLSTGDVFDYAEARTYAGFHVVYGGALTLGDHPAKLNARGRQLLATALKHSRPGTPGAPLDVEERNVPARWLRPHDGGWMLGLFNWDDGRAMIALSHRDMRRIGDAIRSAENIWTGEKFEWPAEPFAVELSAHDSCVLLLRN
jgi:hypothetical protein